MIAAYVQVRTCPDILYYYEVIQLCRIGQLQFYPQTVATKSETDTFSFEIKYRDFYSITPPCYSASTLLLPQWN